MTLLALNLRVNKLWNSKTEKNLFFFAGMIYLQDEKKMKKLFVFMVITSVGGALHKAKL